MRARWSRERSCPADLEVVANGRLLGRKRHGAKRTWLWTAPEPMASYLATVDIGRFDTHRYRTDDRLWMYDALDPDLFTKPATGEPGSPAGDPFWRVVIGDPGPEFLFDNAVYFRGAMAVHELRNEVGDRDFFRILHAWTTRKAGGNGTIPQFIGLAERVSGAQLDDLFRVWLFTGSKPVLEPAAAVERARGADRLRR